MSAANDATSGVMGTEATRGEIVVVGLGPGDPGLLTRDTLGWLEAGRPLWLRTRIHPTVAGLPGADEWASFDALYEAAESFAALYDQIAGALIEQALATHAADGGPIVYAVPGHPTIGESTVAILRVAALRERVALRIVPAVSFLDALAPLLPIDPLRESAQIVDALELAAALDREPFAGGTLPISPLRPAIVGQVYNAATASATKLALGRLYPDDHPITILRASGVSGDETTLTVPLHDLDRGEAGAHDHLTTLFVPALAPERATRVAVGLQAIVARLRAPDGCPWDREQTHQSIRANFLEETYEALDALDAGDMDAFREELGDVLLQVYLQAQMAEEEGEFVLEDIYEAIGTKLVRRHPHVFGDVTVSDSGEVLRNWDQIKEVERRAKGERAAKPAASALDGIPRSLPALARATLTQERVERLAPTALRHAAADHAAILDGALGVLRADNADPTAARAALGAALFALGGLARSRALDPEEALGASLAAFGDRFRALEGRLRTAGREWTTLTPGEMGEVWESTKYEVRSTK